MISSREIADLLPVVQPLCHAFIDKCKQQGIDVLITCTFRDYEAQDALFAKGRTLTLPGAKVTNARGGESFHNFRVAFDFVPLVHGKAIWTDTATFLQCGKIAESLGLEWAGRWVHFKEMAHCQYTGGLTLADFRAGKVPHG
jgi:peptidoglycan LD-endopeptidase CwlK